VHPLISRDHGREEKEPESPATPRRGASIWPLVSASMNSGAAPPTRECKRCKQAAGRHCWPIFGLEREGTTEGVRKAAGARCYHIITSQDSSLPETVEQAAARTAKLLFQSTGSVINPDVLPLTPSLLRRVLCSRRRRGHGAWRPLRNSRGQQRGWATPALLPVPV